MYSKTTHDIHISVEVDYLVEESKPDESMYAWAYHVEISNHQEHAVQLLRRHWKITDSNGITKEVVGDGVVGQQPVIEPDDMFDYASGTWLNTTSGMMHGAYTMQDINGDEFEVSIPAFSLDIPGENRVAN